MEAPRFFCSIAGHGAYKSPGSKMRLRGPGDDPNVIKCPEGFYFILNFSRRSFFSLPPCHAWCIYIHIYVFNSSGIHAARRSLSISPSLFLSLPFSLPFPPLSPSVFLSVPIYLSRSVHLSFTTGSLRLRVFIYNTRRPGKG